MISDDGLRSFRATIEVSHEDGDALLALPEIAGRLLEEVEELRARLHEFMGADAVDHGRDKPASQRAHELWERILSWPAMALPILQNLIDEVEAAKKLPVTRGGSKLWTDLLDVLREVSAMETVDNYDQVNGTVLLHGHVRDMYYLLRLLVDEEDSSRKDTTRKYAVEVLTHWSTQDENVVALAAGYLVLTIVKEKGAP
jgi:hypothetical protein